MTEQTYLLMHRHINGYGRLFGGQLMQWIDELAGIVSMRHAGGRITTASIDNLNFKAGAYLNDTIVLIGRITYVGRTSMEVRVDTYVEDLEGMRRVINRAYVVMVAIDEEGHAVEVPGLIVESESEKAEWEAGQKRYALRKQRRREGFYKKKDGSRIMKTITANIKEGIDQEIITEAGGILKDGGLVAFPTETVYGLGGNALDEQAAEKIYAAKGRPSDNPLIVHIAEFEALNKIAAEIPEEAKMLADAFWPGPLTMIFQKTDLVPMGTTGGLNTVAVRMPDHPVALALIRAAGGYIAAPSANTSGRPSPTCAAHVQEDLDGRIEMILDGGPVGIGLESTIVDLSEGVPTILRPGYINQQMLEEVIGKTEIDRAILSDDSGIKPKAPGMKYRHYAPKASLTIVEGEQEKVTAKINELLKEGEAAGEKIGVIASTETAADYLGGIVRTIGSRSDELSISRHLFGILRDFDTLQVDRIYSESFETPQMGQAIMNRLMKAAGHQVMEV